MIIEIKGDCFSERPEAASSHANMEMVTNRQGLNNPLDVPTRATGG